MQFLCVHLSREISFMHAVNGFTIHNKNYVFYLVSRDMHPCTDKIIISAVCIMFY